MWGHLPILLHLVGFVFLLIFLFSLLHSLVLQILCVSSGLHGLYHLAFSVLRLRFCVLVADHPPI